MNRPARPTWEHLDIDAPDDRWWLPWLPRTEVLRQVRALWAAHIEQVDATSAGLEQLRRKIMASAAEYAARLDAVANEIAQELRDAKSQAEAEGNAAWSAALDGPIARLEGMGKSEETPDAPGNEQAPAEPADGAVPVEQQPDDAA